MIPSRESYRAVSITKRIAITAPVPSSLLRRRSKHLCGRDRCTSISDIRLPGCQCGGPEAGSDIRVNLQRGSRLPIDLEHRDGRTIRSTVDEDLEDARGQRLHNL